MALTSTQRRELELSRLGIQTGDPVARLARFLGTSVRTVSSEQGRAAALRTWRQGKGISAQEHARMCASMGRFDYAELIRRYG